MTKSLLGFTPDDFRHAVVFLRHPGEISDNFARVFRYTYEGQDTVTNDRVSRHYKRIATSYTGWAYTCDSLLIYNGPEILNTLRLALSMRHDYLIHVKSGPPGAGKTYDIVKSHDTKTDFVTCPVRDSILDTRSNLAKRYGVDARQLKLRVRTIDSYLVNYGEDKATRDLHCTRVLLDEAYMEHAGKLYAVAALLGAVNVQAYGDRQQIPYVVRAQYVAVHKTLRHNTLEDSWITYRCPPSAVAAWGHMFDWRVRAKSKVEDKIQVVEQNPLQYRFSKGDVILTMYQADKKLLQARLRHEKIIPMTSILTTHEAEGRTYDNVVLVRTDVRNAGSGFSLSLYDQAPYVLVAMSRHRKSFKYVTTKNVGDLVCKLIEQSHDVRRVVAAADELSAGDIKQQ